MQRESTNQPGTAKVDSAHEVTLESASIWAMTPHTPNLGQPHDDLPGGGVVPPPDWARYIDSRLKQFCTR